MFCFHVHNFVAFSTQEYLYRYLCLDPFSSRLGILKWDLTSPTPKMYPHPIPCNIDSELSLFLKFYVYVMFPFGFWIEYKQLKYLCKFFTSIHENKRTLWTFVAYLFCLSLFCSWDSVEFIVGELHVDNSPCLCPNNFFHCVWILANFKPFRSFHWLLGESVSPMHRHMNIIACL